MRVLPSSSLFTRLPSVKVSLNRILSVSAGSGGRVFSSSEEDELPELLVSSSYFEPSGPSMETLKSVKEVPIQFC